MNDRDLLQLSVNEAALALKDGNYPFGAVIADTNNQIIASAHNENFSLKDITAHAEMKCLQKIDIRSLLDSKTSYSIYCSGEPCGGCSFFIARTNIKKVTWALTDPQKAGFDDLRKDALLREYFAQIEVAAEPFTDLKKKSSELLWQFYMQTNQPHKSKLY